MITYAIYVVDDDKFVRESIRAALSSDYLVDTFSTAESGLEAIQTSPPDLVLLDEASEVHQVR